MARSSRNDNWKETKEKGKSEPQKNDGKSEDRKKFSVQKKIPGT